MLVIEVSEFLLDIFDSFWDYSKPVVSPSVERTESGFKFLVDRAPTRTPGVFYHLEMMLVPCPSLLISDGFELWCILPVTTIS
ncbi:hypothetical protein L195_g002674 [Trifolium pratense]|uniref:Uncharacterized protein n=1 Tax=Trifolium pratense TaxID=57577 RepID=A0A2K3NT53_TRIPR|nr:hypothetical protein L195_g002674 [Trifolium pratense]